jgi:hypothetical protein
MFSIFFPESSTNLSIQSISHEAFAQKQMGLLFENVTDAESRSVSCSQARCSHSAFSDDSTRSESGALVQVGNGSAKTKGRDLIKNYSSHSSLKEGPYAASNSSDEVRYSIRFQIYILFFEMNKCIYYIVFHEKCAVSDIFASRTY